MVDVRVTVHAGMGMGKGVLFILSPVPKLRMGVTINVVFDKFKITSLKFK